jgi:Domain of unknown function (DUF4062)
MGRRRDPSTALPAPASRLGVGSLLSKPITGRRPISPHPYNVSMSKRSDSQPEPLLIDRAAAAELPSDAAVREWTREKRAFISSVMADMAEERQAAAGAARSVGVRAVLFEEFGGRDADPEEAYLAEVEGADIYIGILGRRYGKPLKARFSATHAEYLHAEKHALRIAVWTSAAPDREGHEQSFLDEVRTFHVVPEFRTIADLQRQVEDRIRAIAAEDLAPWCKLGNTVFRATEVEDRGDVINVTARVRDSIVAQALEAARGDRFNRGTKAQFTWSGRSKYVKVAGVQVTTTAAKSQMFRLQLEAEEAPQDHFLSIGGMTPADLTESALRTVLFGELNPLADQHMGFATEIDDPLRPLRQSPVSEEIIRPLSELLLTDLLVGSGRARSIRAFRLGVAIRGRRRLTLAWETPSRFSNEPVTVRSISGEVNI